MDLHSYPRPLQMLCRLTISDVRRGGRAPPQMPQEFERKPWQVPFLRWWSGVEVSRVSGSDEGGVGVEVSGCSLPRIMLGDVEDPWEDSLLQMGLGPKIWQKGVAECFGSLIWLHTSSWRLKTYV